MLSIFHSSGQFKISRTLLSDTREGSICDAKFDMKFTKVTNQLMYCVKAINVPTVTVPRNISQPPIKSIPISAARVIAYVNSP
ncbi:hypothetical protein JYK00_02030 [Thermosipho ferrireducens]|uniref:Uncharacterized protein n=1 Tax=Thermosipho ferrireducens TaxID=2571116 RepID=A0ABX7S802_9BACT|nr:hypothetical protein [Thermosipho ferrireducens]QTA38339.1 hypothetical protein JYK00_02030 [Thermosipho ferrireducens]